MELVRRLLLRTKSIEGVTEPLEIALDFANTKRDFTSTPAQGNEHYGLVTFFDSLTGTDADARHKQARVPPCRIDGLSPEET